MINLSLNSRNTIALNNNNEFEYLASILASWDETFDGLMRKRAALYQLLVRSEIGGYVKSRVDGNRDLLKWSKEGSYLVVLISRVKDRVYNIEVLTNIFMAKAMNIAEL